VSLPSEARLPTPTAATRLLVAQRPLAEGEGSLSAEWATSDRKSVKIRHAGSFPLEECWVVSKDSVWRLGPIAADSTSTQELTKPTTFADWGSMLLKDEGVARLRDEQDPWRRLNARRTGLVLTFDEALHSLWVPSRERTRYRLYERGVDLTSTLERGGVVLVGSFDRNLSTFRCTPEVPMKSFGWARARIREGNR